MSDEFKDRKRITPAVIRSIFPKRSSDTQKWDYGHCLIIAGSREFFGAALLATEAALRGGTGLVTLATPKSLQPLVYSRMAAPLTLPLEETLEGAISTKALETVLSYIYERRISAVVLGPGLTRQESTADFVNSFIIEAETPLVLDADALNIKPSLKKQNVFCCLTPHRKELARLLNTTSEDVAANGVVLAQGLVQEHANLVVVLKGFHTKVISRDGVWVNPTGNPGMAKGGCGDVLSGLLGSLLAQQKDNKSYLGAVLASVYIHGLAGDLAVRDLTEIALNAEDLVHYLPKAFKKVIGI